MNIADRDPSAADSQPKPDSPEYPADKLDQLLEQAKGRGLTFRKTWKSTGFAPAMPGTMPNPGIVPYTYSAFSIAGVPEQPGNQPVIIMRETMAGTRDRDNPTFTATVSFGTLRMLEGDYGVTPPDEVFFPEHVFGTSMFLDNNEIYGSGNGTSGVVAGWNRDKLFDLSSALTGVMIGQNMVYDRLIKNLLADNL